MDSSSPDRIDLLQLRASGNWSESVEQLRREVLERGMRIGGAVVGFGVLVLWLERSLSPSWKGPFSWTSISAFALLIAFIGVFLSVRTARKRRSIRQLALEAGTISILCTILIGVVTLGASPEFVFVHPTILTIVMGYSMLLPFPPRFALPTLAIVCSTFPVVLLLGGDDPLSIPFALVALNMSAAFAISTLAAALHADLLRSRYSALISLARQAEHDSLTGTLNRRTLFERLIIEHDRCAREDQAIGIVIVDIDRFKLFNSRHGYAVGDRVLRAVARVLLEPIKDPNGRWKRAGVGRYGGEEFMVVLPAASESEVAEYARQVVASVRNLRIPGVSPDTTLTVSVGIHSFSATTQEELGRAIERTDRAMYLAKRAGGDRIELATDDGAGPRPKIEDLAAELFAPRRSEDDRGPVRDDRNRMHASLLRITFYTGALWVMLYGISDVAQWLIEPEYPLLVVMASRAGISALSIFAVPFVRPELGAIRLSWANALTALTLICMLVWWSHFSLPEFLPIHVTGAIVAIAGWTLAVGSPAWMNLTVPVVCSLVFIGGMLLGHPQTLPPIAGVVMVGVLGAISLVAATSQRMFRHLRADEFEMRLELIRLSRIDGLTGLWNRSGFDERLQDELARADHDGPLSLIVVDLDHFKRLNDSLGHVAGDEALAETARVLSREIRLSDSVARLGGEEFAVILPRTSLEEAESIAERLRSRLHRVQVSERDWKLSGSFGVVQSDRGEDPDTLLSRADLAVRTAKRRGRDQVLAESNAATPSPRPPTQAE